MALPNGTTVVVYNTGSNAAYVTLGNSSVTATTSNDVIQPNSWLAFTAGATTYLAALETAGTTTLNISGGSGLATGAGGGGGGSGSGSVPTGSAGSPNASVVTMQGVSGMTPVKTDGSAVTQPVSATSLPLPTGAATSVNQTNVQSAPGSSASTAVTVQGSTSGVAIPVTGTFFQTTQPVSLASLPALAAGANTIGSIANASFGISGTLPAFAATPTVNVGTFPALTTGANTIGKVDLLGNAGATMDVAQGGATAATNALQIAGVYDLSPPTLANGQGAALLLDASGNLKVNVAAGGASGGTSSNFATPFPSIGTAAGGEYYTPGTLTSGQMYPLALDASGNLKVNVAAGGGGSGNGNTVLGVSSAAAWTTATALNTTQMIWDGTAAAAYSQLTVQLDITATTVTAGAITFEGTNDGTNWVALDAYRVTDPTSALGATVSIPYTIPNAASTIKKFTLDVQGYQQVRMRLSTAITGTGSPTLTPYITSVPLSGAVALLPSGQLTTAAGTSAPSVLTVQGSVSGVAIPALAAQSGAWSDSGAGRRR